MFNDGKLTEISHDRVIPPCKQNLVITKEWKDAILSSLRTLQTTCDYIRIKHKIKFKKGKIHSNISWSCNTPLQAKSYHNGRRKRDNPLICSDSSSDIKIGHNIMLKMSNSQKYFMIVLEVKFYKRKYLWAHRLALKHNNNGWKRDTKSNSDAWLATPSRTCDGIGS